MILLRDLLKTKQASARTPIWFMRQAGRYLPEYLELRSNYPDFLSFCADPKGASEATLQPLRRFDLDAAIIFSDILVVPAALGQNVTFIKGQGPKLDPIRSWEDAKRLSDKLSREKLLATPEAIALTKNKLSPTQTLIGFSGAPWTVLCYMLEGGGSKNFDEARYQIAKNPEMVAYIVDLLVEVTTTYLCDQIKAGADVIKLFDSWAGLCPNWLHQKMLLEPISKICKGIRAHYPDFPIIYFPRGTQIECVKYAYDVGGNGVALDQFVNPQAALDSIKRNSIVFQGGMDPMVMKCGGKILESEVNRLMSIFAGQPYIFNLGHGMVPEMPIENVEKTISLVRAFDKQNRAQQAI